ncbi:MAG: ABC-F family ATP-binding cassette domain-containing protein [Nitrospinota bacterium]|nr:ABC-F family ATP-binding cassette domain-containing protein [Nitrospinota bacterium]
MIRLDNISKAHGGTPVFSELSIHIRPGRRVGLVGDNGAGKTTLLNILAGDLSPDEGRRIVSPGVRIGILRQETGGEDHVPLLENVIAGADHLVVMQDEMNTITDRLHEAESREDLKTVERLAHDLAEAQERFHDAGGYAVEGKARAILVGLGFTPDQFDRPTGAFSGGWRMRMSLARLLLSHPGLLLLDEPTNHLDLESSIWLESFLTSYDGSLLIISHDRFFLNRMVDSIAEIEFGKLTLYPFPYDRYVEEKQIRREHLESAANRQQKEIAHQERFIERFRAKNTKATLVKSREKALNKIERIETVKQTRGIGFKFVETGRIGHTPVEVIKATVAYGDNVVYRDLDFSIRRGDRIALVGPNGAGKSTLIKLLSGLLSPKSGILKISESVSMRHFAQHQIEALDPEKTVLDELISGIPFDAIPRARGILGAFLFRKDDVEKLVKVLSGGEKSRLALAKIALNPTNLMLLDEPTNHLDLKSRQALEKALAGYKGCLVLISHDRAFIDGVANKIVHVEHGQLTEFLGDWMYYERTKEQKLGTAAAMPDAVIQQSAPATVKDKKSKKEARQEAARQRNERRGNAGKLKKDLTAVETRIAAVEVRSGKVEQLLADPDTYKDQSSSVELARELAALKSENAKLLLRWESLSGQIEAIGSGA